MKLLTIDNDGFSLKIEPELYTIGEFANLVESRKKNPSLLFKELGYIYFTTDMASDFQFQIDETERSKEVKKYVDLPDTWKKDRALEAAIEAYKYLSQTPASRLLQAAYIGADKLKNQLERLDLNERDKSGKPVWNIKQFNDTLKAIASTIESLNEAEKKYIKFQNENTKIRGNKTSSVYDGIDLGK